MGSVDRVPPFCAKCLQGPWGRGRTTSIEPSKRLVKLQPASRVTASSPGREKHSVIRVQSGRHSLIMERGRDVWVLRGCGVDCGIAAHPVFLGTACRLRPMRSGGPREALSQVRGPTRKNLPMPLRRPPPKRPTRSRIQTSIAGDVHEQVDLYCAHHGLSESAFFEAAALEKLGGTGNAKQIFRRFNDQRRMVLQLQHHVEIFAELLSFHVQYSLRNTPPLPKAELQETRRQGDALYQSLIRRIGENLSSRRGFFEAFPSEEPQNEHGIDPSGGSSAEANGTRPRPGPHTPQGGQDGSSAEVKGRRGPGRAPSAVAGTPHGASTVGRQSVHSDRTEPERAQ